MIINIIIMLVITTTQRYGEMNTQRMIRIIDVIFMMMVMCMMVMCMMVMCMMVMCMMGECDYA
jgi:hypothetical protein